MNWASLHVRISVAGCFDCEPRWALPVEWADRFEDFDLWYVWRGRGEMTLGRAGRRIVLRTGVCLLARPGGKYCATHDPRHELAEEAGYSLDHFARVFREQTGLSPQDCLLRAGLERAKQLLLDSDRSIAQVAADLGYSSPGFFSRQFRARTGQSPRQFRHHTPLC